MIELGPRELSVRVQPVGGDVQPSVQEGRDHLRTHLGRVLLLVHGYNNTLDAARGSYEMFLDHVTRQAQGLDDAGYGFFWPGDANLGFFALLSYPTEIADAAASGERLATFLRDLYLGDPTIRSRPVDIVAHSLGARVVLEALRVLEMQGGLPGILRGVVLMAAAVPVEHLEIGGRLERATWLPEIFVVLYSYDDRTLHWAFPPGQLAAEGFWATALGRVGPPRNILARPTGPLPGVGHGGYWPDSGRVLDEVIDGLAYVRRERAVAPPATPMARELGIRDVGSRSAAVERVLGA